MFWFGRIILTKLHEVVTILIFSRLPVMFSSHLLKNYHKFWGTIWTIYFKNVLQTRNSWSDGILNSCLFVHQYTEDSATNKFHDLLPTICRICQTYKNHTEGVTICVTGQGCITFTRKDNQDSDWALSYYPSYLIDTYLLPALSNISRGCVLIMNHCFFTDDWHWSLAQINCLYIN